jgi:hypothetical protein
MRSNAAVVVGVVLAVAVAACSSGSSDVEALPPASDEQVSTSSSTTTSSTTTSSTVATTTTAMTDATPSTLADGKPILEIPTEWDSDLDEIFGRYLLYWEALAIANGPPAPTPDYPPLAELVDPEALTELRGQIQENLDAGIVLREADTATEHVPRLPNPSVLSKAEGNEVTIQDCFVDGRVVESSTGEVLDDAVVTGLLNVKMQVVGGEWLVVGLRDASPESDGFEECRQYGTEAG